MRDEVGLENRYGTHTEHFSKLMEHRVREVLLVSSQYDAFVLEEDGHLTEMVFKEYQSLSLNLRYTPTFTRAEDGAEALIQLEENEFQLLIITSIRLRDMDLLTFCREVKARHPEMPVAILAAHGWELPRLAHLQQEGVADLLFLWQGDASLLLAIIKQVEDRHNAVYDVLEAGVQAIILVEDDVQFYSFYLPRLYRQITQQTGHLMVEGLNLSHRLLRMRARPKILLACTYDQAWEYVDRYGSNVLGVISDVSYPRGGEQDPEAGLELARRVRDRLEDTPVLLQSTELNNRVAAEETGASFLYKLSPVLEDLLREYILKHFGFGDFVFCSPGGEELARASNLRELLAGLETLPAESLLFHARRNHFSRWLKARTEFELARDLRPVDPDEFASPQALRQFLRRTIFNYLCDQQRHVTTLFDEERYDRFAAFARLGSGSLGGKGRGLAFMHKLLAKERVQLPGVEVAIPQTLVLSADIFDEFVRANKIRQEVVDPDHCTDDEIVDAFRRGRFDTSVRKALARFLHVVTDPIAVRSSSILEDSLYQPFAGVYSTLMLSNNHPSLDVRLCQLIEAIKCVYASTWRREARDYLDSTPHRGEEERMAVLLQRVVGSPRGSRFYPSFSGVACSYNFYPFRDMRPEDGVAQVAVGLGKSVVEGIEALRFCPTYPQVMPQFSAVKDVLRNAQRRFYALDLRRRDVIPSPEEDASLVQLEVSEAISAGAVDPLVSTYLRENDRIMTGRRRDGVPLITFASLLKSQGIPLPELLTNLLHVCQRGMGVPVEIEFAMDLPPGHGGDHIFHVLQVRPMVVERTGEKVQLTPEIMSKAVVTSERALGHGRLHALQDVIMVTPNLDRAKTADVVMVLDEMNRALRRDGRSCILVGPGRWGSADPWLGIPVAWSQISQARVIVETDFVDMEVEPSQGSHFFHNLTSFGVAFFDVRLRRPEDHIDWAFLNAQSVERVALDGAVKHVRLERPLLAMVDGATSRGAITLGE